MKNIKLLHAFILGMVVVGAAQNIQPADVNQTELLKIFDQLSQFLKDKKFDEFKVLFQKNLEIVNVENANGNRLLHMAVVLSLKDFFRLLLENNSDLFYLNKKGKSAFDIMQSLKDKEEYEKIIVHVALQRNDAKLLYNFVECVGIERILQIILIMLEEDQSVQDYLQFLASYPNDTDVYNLVKISVYLSALQRAVVVGDIVQLKGIIQKLQESLKSLNELNGRLGKAPITLPEFLQQFFYQKDIDFDEEDVDLESSELKQTFCSILAVALMEIADPEKLKLIINELCKTGININAVCHSDGYIPIIWLMSCQDNEKLLSLLIAKGANVNEIQIWPDATSDVALSFAMSRNQKTFFVTLLRQEADINIELLHDVTVEEKDGLVLAQALMTPLMESFHAKRDIFFLSNILEIRQGYYDLNQPIELKFVDTNSNEKKFSSETKTLLCWAMHISDLNDLSHVKKYMDLLIQYGAEINQIFRWKEIETTVLTFALQELESLDAKSIKEERQRPALESMVEFLLSRGASVLIPNEHHNAIAVIDRLVQVERNKTSGDQSLLEMFLSIQKTLKSAVHKERNFLNLQVQHLQKQQAASYQGLRDEESGEFKMLANAWRKEVAKDVKQQARAQRKVEFQKAQQESKFVQQEQLKRQAQPVQSPTKAAESLVGSKALPVKPRYISPLTLLQKFGDQNLSSNDWSKIQNYLKNISDNLKIPFSLELQKKYGFKKNLFGKKDVRLNIHHIFTPTVSMKNDQLDISGGHWYQSLNNLVQFPIVKQAQIQCDQRTACCNFRLYPNVKDAPQIIKTVFPRDWSIEQVLEAIITSTFVSHEKDDQGMNIVRSITTTNPAIPLKLIFKPAAASSPETLITAMPEI